VFEQKLTTMAVAAMEHVGMLEMTSIGVAVGNACPRAQEEADYLMEETKINVELDLPPNFLALV
jgi:hypothetical protein